MMTYAPAPVAPQAAPALPQAPTAAAAPAKNPNLKEIVSPMVGTFYKAPPRTPNLRDAGPDDRAGNDRLHHRGHESHQRNQGRGARKNRGNLVQNAEPVEYGQALFRVEPA